MSITPNNSSELPNDQKEGQFLQAFADRPLTNTVWFLSRARKTIIWSTLFCFIAGLLWITLRPSEYTVSMIIAPNIDMTKEEQGTSSSATSAVRTLMGGAVGGEEDELYKRFLLLYTSYPVLRRLDEKYDVMKVIYKDNWDEAAQKWRPKTSLPSRIKYWINSILGGPEWQPPNHMDLTVHLLDQIEITRVQKWPARRISVEHENVEFYANFIEWLFQETTSYIREDALHQIDVQLKMIENKLTTISVTEHRLALLETLTRLQRSQLMMAEGIPVGAIMLQPPAKSSKRSSPDIISAFIFSLLSGLAIGIGLAGFRIYILETWRAQFAK
jgi:hypothetical protein